MRKRLSNAALKAAAIVSLSLASLSLASLSLAARAQAGPAAEKMARSEELLAAGKPATALKVAGEAFDLLWDKMPFTINYATFTIAKATGYGIFNPRRNNVFNSGDKMFIYVEPVGYGHGKVQKGIYQLRIRTDIAIRDASGKVVMSKKGFGKFKLTSRRRNHEFYLNLSISLTGAPAGKYTLEIPVTDEVKGQTASFRLPFTITK